MSSVGSKIPPRFIKFLVLFLLVVITVSVSVSAGLTPERIPTSLTITALPVDPTINQSFHVSGLLTDVGGDLLGNKRIVLESSGKISPENEDFSSIDLVVTGRDGRYEFLRPKWSSPEYLRVRFIGNDDYAPSASQVMGVRGIGTDHPQVRGDGTGNIMISTNPQVANIYIDNILQGVTPQRIAGLTEGPHDVLLTKEGYQNETMEAYVTPERDVSFDITLSVEGSTIKTGGGAISDLWPGIYESSHLAYTKMGNNSSSSPDVAVDVSRGVMKITGNEVSNPSYIHLNNSTESSPKTNSYNNLKVSTIVTNNTLGDGYDVMVIMTDH
jgi:hypothetical protein